MLSSLCRHEIAAMYRAVSMPAILLVLARFFDFVSGRRSLGPQRAALKEGLVLRFLPLSPH